MILVALGAGYTCTIILGFLVTFALGRLLPTFVARGERLRPAFMLVSLLVWAGAASAGGMLATVFSPLRPALTSGGLALLLAGAMIHAAILQRKQLPLYYQIALACACVAGAMAGSGSVLSL